MLFTAGFGTRMGALTKNLPKPMIPVAGRPLVDHSLELALEISPKTVVANVHYLPEALIDHLGPQGVIFSHETDEILETGGGLKAALSLLGAGAVFTANTDVIWKGPNPFSLLLSAWKPDQMDGLLMCVEQENAVGHTGNGDFIIDETGRITRGPGAVFGGIQIIKTDLLNTFSQSSFSLNLVWNKLLASGSLFGHVYPGSWCDVGNPQGITLAETLLEKHDV
jgi:MurNAc alpha-1-phosphate uridylyltransferase